MLDFKSQAAFTILEIIIAISILSFGVIAVYSAFTASVISTNYIYNRFVAANLAQEGVEIVRNIRDNNWLSGASWSAGLLNCTQGCEGDYKTGVVSGSTLTAYSGRFLGINTSSSDYTSNGFYSYDLGSTPTIFKRDITITPVCMGSDCTDLLDVLVSVTWNYNGKSFSSQAEEYLYNWH